MDLLKVLLIFSSIMATIMCISIPMDQFKALISDRCYNQTYERKPLVLGQSNPVGLSIENLISLIEKIETKKPELTAQQVIVMILRRFHADGVQWTGANYNVHNVELTHRRITEEIMKSSALSAIGNIDFPEDVLTEDEKCNLFYTISHTINDTARHDEDKEHTYQNQRYLSRAPVKPDNKTNVKNLNTSAPIQSVFLGKPPLRTQPVVQMEGKTLESKQDIRQSSGATDNDNNENKRLRRADPQTQRQTQTSTFTGPYTATRRPRERGVASFINDKFNAIAVNRVLLGTAVGLLTPAPKTTRDLIKSIKNSVNVDIIPDGSIDPLLSVTLSDILGIDADMGVQTKGEVLFGASGEWNSSYCQTSYKLKTKGTALGTLAEIRGGVDGWNIGRKLQSVLQLNPKITLSQILRQYYSQRGLASDAWVCNRGWALSSELQNKVKPEAENYIRVWNGVHYENTYPDTQLTGFVAETWPSFSQFLNKVNDKTQDERDYCNPLTGTDIKSAPCESSADVFFLLDNMPAQGTGNLEELEILKQVVKRLNLGRNGGSVTVMVNSNAQGGSDQNFVDENNVPLNLPIYTLAYSTTSSQCATCRAAYYDNSQTPIKDRALLMELVNKTLMPFELRKADLAGVPSKSFVWFDYDNLNPVPTEREQKRKYEDFKWRLRYEHRDVTFFMATLNKEGIKDLLRRDEDYIEVGKGVDAATMKGQELVEKICQTPQTFQHNECRVASSKDKKFESYLTPGYKQYWAMYPEYFIKSYTIDMTFRAEKAKIKVCFDRFPEPQREERRCSEAKDDGGEVKWTVSNPCQGKTFESCPAFYFAISLSSQTGSQVAGNNDCTDPGCKSPDQVKWSFTHTGVSCNSSHNLLPNWSFQLICFILFLTILCINGKRNQYLD